MKKELTNITLIGIDCINLKRLQLAADISMSEISFGAVKLLTSIQSDDPRVINIPKINSTKQYSEFMIKELHKYVDTEFALIFQYDGFVLNSSAWTDEFFKYDYIGSPWYHLGNLRVGNGGFSLRSKKLLDWLGNNWKTINARIHPEDVYISRFARSYLEKEGMKFAPEEVASKFAMEGNERSVVWKGEFGFHGIKYTDISGWLIKNPQYKEIFLNKLSNYFLIMKKYPVYDGTVHTFRFKKQNLKDYIQHSKNQKNYEARLIKDEYFEFKDIKVGDTVIFKKSGTGIKNTIPIFEKTIVRIEKFKSFNELRLSYPEVHITYPIKDIPKWKRPFVKIMGDFAYPKNNLYSIFWFD